MSGHSKWSTIKHKKGAADAKRGKVFTKITKEIAVSARMGGGDLQSNSQLRVAVLKAKAANMPKDNIERAVKKGLGELKDVEYAEMLYEAYAPGGVGLLIEILTDNKNRTAADIKHILNKGGGQLASSGSVSYQFHRKGLIVFDREAVDENKLLEAALEAGAEDIIEEKESIEVLTETDNFEAVWDDLRSRNFQEAEASISLIPENKVRVEPEKLQKIHNLIEKIEDNQDVQSVVSNLDDDLSEEE